jgi:hypothetical protein
MILLTHPGVSQLQHKHPISFSIEIRSVLAADSIMVRNGVGVAMSVIARGNADGPVRVAGLAGARLRPTSNVLERALSN